MALNFQDKYGHQALDAKQHYDHFTGNAIISGVTPSAGSSGLEVDIASGTAIVNGSETSVSSQTVTLNTADSTNSRKDVITIDSTGTATVYTGTAEARKPEQNASKFDLQRPAPDDLNGINEAVVAEVFVAEGATTLGSSDVRDRRNIASAFAGSLDMYGDIDMGSNSITSVNQVDGVDVTNHSSRHSDGGSDELDAADLSGGLGTSGQVLQTDGSAASWADLESETVNTISGDYTTSGETTLLLKEEQVKYSLLNASYTGTSISTQDGGPESIAFNNDGTKMFTITNTALEIYEYSLSTAYDITTATLQNTISTQDSDPSGIEFNNDGTKMYETGYGGSAIYEYSLSTAYDISTASFQDSLTTDTSGPESIAFNSDGSKFVLIDSKFNNVYEYSMSTAYNISTASSTGASKTAEGNSGVTFNDDGTKMFEVDDDGNSIKELSLSTPYDITTASLENNLGTEDSLPKGIDFNGDGSKMVVIGTSSNLIREYTTSTTTRVSSVTLSSNDASESGKIVRVVDTAGNAGTNNVTIDTESGETIMGESDAVLDKDYETIVFQSDGTDWFVLSGNGGFVE